MRTVESKRFPSRIETLILTILDRVGEQTGVEIRDRLLEIATVTVYTALRRMRMRGWIGVAAARCEDARQRLYSIKQSGRRALKAASDAYDLVIEETAKP